MATYTYTIFDANPASSSGTAWPSHEGQELECDSDEEAVAVVLDVMEIESAGLSPDDGYAIGDRLHSIIWSDDGVQLAGCPTYVLTAEDLGLSTIEDVATALSRIAEMHVDSDDRGHITEHAPDSSDDEYGGNIEPGSAWDEECGARLAEIREALPEGWSADWSDDDVIIERDSVEVV